MTIFMIILVSVLLAEEFSAASTNHNSINKKGAAENVETLYQHLFTHNNNNNGGSGGLFPNVFNLATRAEITVNATCGERGIPEVYCKLVEHVQTRSPQCGTCDANSPDPERRHPIQHAIDGTPRWWQSPSLQYGPQYEWVTITLDLKQVYQVAYVIVKSAISPRPANWILERSVDGSTYRPWQYYAQSDEECWTRYGIPPTRGKPHYISDDEVICTSYYSKLNPLEGGEIHTSLVVGRPGANESSKTLRDFTLARYVRLRLQKIRTLNAEFMSPSIGTLDDTYVARRLFYSIKDISIGGQCVCSGHASHCPHNSKSGSLQCECQHNTCGSNCERCCPLYNLFPWRAGTPSDGAECERCECHGHATSCRYDPEVETSHTSMDTHGQYRGGGVCNNCSKHTTGLNCEKCEDGWYRPHGVSRRAIKPCERCDCGDSPGATGHCAQDGNVQGKKAGTCECKPGYSGEKCEVCAPGFKGFPRCEGCPCDPHGTADCEGKGCTCKPHVTGTRCDSCIPGYFALHAGCLPCFCSGLGTTCKAAKNLHKSKVGGTLAGWLVSDLAVSKTVQPTFDDEIGELVVGNYQLPGVESYFWLAPEVYLGNRLTSYGSNVKFSVGWIVMRGDTSGRPTLGPDAVLVGHNGVRLGSGSGWYKPSNVTLSIPLVEKSWYHIPADVIDIGGQEYHRGKPASRTDLLGVLSNVRHLLLRAKFHTDQIEGSLAEGWVEIGEKGGSGSSVELVEKCDCPPGYTGLSCELCDYGYTRVTLEGNTWECKRCNCNGHAPTCDPITGQCTRCEHNTNGTNCDTCLLGFYGDATKGTPEDCQPCACPLLEPINNFSPKCELQPGSDDEYVCTSCPTGYDGDHCEKCINGYFGSPTEPGSTCKPCECGDGPCDGVTGQCLQCRGNTEGWHCERCLPNHYGDPSQADCKACACNALGSRITNSCDEKTGQCECHEHLAGRACDRCESGYGNVSAGCVPCSCHPVGSLSADCDPVTGQCPCHPGVNGPQCDTCQEVHYGFSATGCKSCGCHTAGSEGSTCDIITGQCTCRPYVSGRACDICKDGFWGLNTSRGCVPCDCDHIGAVNNFCDPHTGQCPCRPGVGGPRCDQCLPGYFGFTAAGCSKCEQCDKPGHVCDPDTGRCVCPPLTTGPTCDHCQPGTWGFEPGKGCKSCGCSTTGSLRPQCDFRTGRCFCREGFYGDRCSGCAPGHFGYPRCQPCDCHSAGTQCTSPETCKHHACDAITGQCPCKDNVIGRRCSQCKAGTFGLHQENQDGCTRCFCFGRTTACTEAGLTLSRILMPPPGTRTIIVEYGNDAPPQSSTGLYPINTQKVYYANLILPGKGEIAINIGAQGQLNATNSLQLIPGDVGDIHIGVSFPFEVPVYWHLPRAFLGDRVLSYGGFLRFRVESEGGHTLLPPSILARYPLVQLQGNGRIVLEHYPILPSSTGYHQIRLHESLWRLKSPSLPGSGNKVTREMLMVALQNVQHILICASESADFTRAVLRDVTLDTGVQLPGQPMPPYARGVELCDCPPQYNATSCQDPSIGFYRWYDNNSVSSTIVIQLVGEARPCHCNQRSRVCDIETGYCLNCSDNTGGPHCEQCGEGYYGDPARGPCKPCPCPTVERNFARSCRVTPKGHVHCFCKEGYTGKRCDRCSYGWFGFPRWEGGSCKPCLCNPYGSVSDECHEQTGQCNCRPGITGRDCSICSRDRFILTAQGCTTCDDECTGVLLNDLARLKIELEKGAGHLAGGVVPPPWTQLEEVNVTAIGLQKWLDLADKVIALPTDTPEKLKRHAQQLLNKSEFVNGRCKKMADDGASVLYESEKLNKEISDIKETIEDVVEGLKRYGQTTASSIVSVSQALREARRLLNKIKGRNLLPRHKAANRALKTCSELVKRIKELLDGIPELKDLREKLKDVSAQLDDILDITNGVIQKTNKAAELTSSNEARLHAMQDRLKQVTTLESEQRAIYAMVEDSNEGSRQLLDIAFDNIEAFRELEANLTMLTRALEQKEGILARLNPLYKEKYVLKAQLHADMLRHRAQVYRDLFNATRRDADFALRASKAYQDIVDALEGARKAAMNASKAAEVAHKTAHPGYGQDSLVDKATDSLNESNKLLNQAKQHTKRVRDLEGSLNQHEKDMDAVQSSLAQAASIDNNINIQLQKLEDKHGLYKVIEKAKEISKTMDRVAEEAAQVGSDVHNILRPRLEKLDTDLQVNTILTHIKTGQENVRQSEDLLSRISEEAVDKHRRFREWNDTLAARLQDLRNKILQAQHAANGIQLSITSRANASGSCVRSYRPSNLQPSTTTSIILDYALDSGNKHRDGMLLFLPSSTTDDFVAVEIVGYHIRFVWDLGGGPGEVQHPLKLQPSVSKEEKIWYRIEVDRTSNIAKLSVRPHKLPDGSPLASGTPVRNFTKAGFGQLDVGPGDLLWVGGLPPTSTPGPPLLKARDSIGLEGCLHQVILNGRAIGLWNFATQNPGGCGACVQSGEQTRDEHTFRFDGDGYAVLHRASSGPYNKYAFSVSLKFRTLDENAILFLAINPNSSDRFVSLTLRDGHVLFRVGYGGSSRLEMASLERHNTGNWTIVEASRLFDRRKKLEKGVLKVEGEARDGAPTPPPGQDALPDLSDALYFVGGFPPGALGNRPPSDLPGSFLGCLAEIQIAQDGYSPLRGQFYGVEAGCEDSMLRRASFRGRGHLELPSHTLKKVHGSFAFVFRTIQTNALLMLTAFRHVDGGEDPGSFYSASLVGGRVDVRVDAGRGGVTLSSPERYDDGQFHSLSVTKERRHLELRVDDVVQDVATLPEGAAQVRAPGASGGLYFGGVPTNFHVTGLAGSSTPLIGTIKDAIFNDQLLDFDHPISFRHVGIGRLDPINVGKTPSLSAATPSVLPQPSEVNGNSEGPHECHKGNSYSLEPGAAKFGDSPHSHVIIRRRSPVLPKGDFTVELDFRTFYPNGLLFIVPGFKGKQFHYILLQLRNKHLLLTIYWGQRKKGNTGSRKVELEAPQDLNDGNWHRVLVARESNKVVMVVDVPGKKRLRKRYPKKLFIGNTMYVGGLPEEDGTTLSEKFIKPEGLKGCLRGLAINQQSQNLVGHRVGQCFPLVEQASYFPGDAYAVYKQEFTVGSLLELQLEFRTSEHTGVLLSVSEPEGYPALSLEVNNGKVVMTGDMGDRQPFRVEQSFPSRYTVCDNRWHRVKAFFVNDELTLKVDHLASMYGHSGNGQFSEASTKSPLYIGGLPEGAPSGTLGTRDNFKGCIRNVVIDGKLWDWTDMAYLHNILLSSCPVSS